MGNPCLKQGYLISNISVVIHLAQAYSQQRSLLAIRENIDIKNYYRLYKQDFRGNTRVLSRKITVFIFRPLRIIRPPSIINLAAQIVSIP